MIKLFELRTEKSLSQRELAKIMNVSQGTYNNWENENTQPSIEQLIALADFFEVSVDYLIGRTDDMGNAVSLPNRSLDYAGKLINSVDTETQEAIITILKKLQK
ncbi:MAG: helix-turn-helix domain-containing protein [Clostridia bacterium]|nr:helix-turn-helix domain-containing protein [Clostridia bacterium]